MTGWQLAHAVLVHKAASPTGRSAVSAGSDPPPRGRISAPQPRSLMRWRPCATTPTMATQFTRISFCAFGLRLEPCCHGDPSGTRACRLVCQRDDPQGGEQQQAERTTTTPYHALPRARNGRLCGIGPRQSTQHPDARRCVPSPNREIARRRRQQSSWPLLSIYAPYFVRLPSVKGASRPDWPTASATSNVFAQFTRTVQCYTPVHACAEPTYPSTHEKHSTPAPLPTSCVSFAHRVD